MTVKSSIPPFENVYTTKETAVRLKVSESFLAKKRVSGGGPKFIKLGRVVRYPEAAMTNTWLRRCVPRPPIWARCPGRRAAQRSGAEPHSPRNRTTPSIATALRPTM